MQAIAGFSKIDNFNFGTAPNSANTIRSLADLSRSFNPYGIAGASVINQEWERYQPFNTKNFVFTNSSVNIEATLPATGGVFPGGINSGQIWSRQTFKPNYNGYSVLAFEVRMKIPSAKGAWPASWLYTKQPGINDASEIDNPEFFVMEHQNQFDWTGFQHGPGCCGQIYSIMTNRWVWHPGIDFSAGYHDYQLIWTPDAVYKYVDGTLVSAQSFTWTSGGPAQIGVNLAVGTSATGILPGLQPNSPTEFPMVLSLEHLYVWAK